MSVLIRAIMGSEDGASLRVSVPGDPDVGKARGHLRTLAVELEHGDRFAFAYSSANGLRAFLCEVDENVTEWDWEVFPMSVGGRFNIIDKENNPRAAAESWKKWLER